MAKFLSKRKLVGAIEDLIKTAGSKLVIISPYLKLPNDFKDMITYRNKQKKSTTFIVREGRLDYNEYAFLLELGNNVVKSVHDLHAKCYSNEKQIIICSLNLYEHSIENNVEFGILIDLNDINDRDLFDKAEKEIEYIINFKAEDKKDLMLNINHQNGSAYKSDVIDSYKSSESTGFCIRCGAKIRFDREHPLCKECYDRWKQHSDPLYKEKYCHKCGIKMDSSFKYPLCKTCYNEINNY